VNDDFSKVVSRGQEFLPYPEEITFVLSRNIYPRLHARMRKEKVAAGEGEPQVSKEAKMRPRQRGMKGCLNFDDGPSAGKVFTAEAVRHQRFHSAEPAHPLFEGPTIAEAFDGDELMIAFQKDVFIALGVFEQAIDGFPRGRTAVDIVTEKDMDWPHDRTRRAVLINASQKVVEKIKPTVDVANRIYSQPCGQRWTPSSQLQPIKLGPRICHHALRPSQGPPPSTRRILGPCQPSVGSCVQRRNQGSFGMALPIHLEGRLICNFPSASILSALAKCLIFQRINRLS
jgi:hypothetical protein